MQQQPPRGGFGQDAAAFSFEAKVDNEEPLVDAMLASLARSALPADAWERLHEAAHRDDRLSEVAFAFESVSQGKRLRTMQPAVAAEFLFQAGRFFGDVFGDETGAVTYLERAISLAPGHAAAFAKLDELLTRQRQLKKLAEVYAGAAQHRPRGEQVPLLRRAALLLAEAGGADDKVMELLQAILRLEPGDEDARSQLETLYVRANRFRDVVRLNEQALAAEPPPSDEARRALLARIVDLYADRLQEPERALPHVEQLLLLDPTHEGARRVAQKLVVIKGLAGRAAAALATAFEASGTPQEVSRYLTLELDSTRGPKRATLLARLGRLRGERLGDPAGAFDAFEQALAIDATDDDLRSRYVALAATLERYADAAKTLGRVLATVKDGAVKAKTSAQLGEMQLRSGDAKRAKATLSGVLSSPEASAGAILAAANSLREIHERDKDARGLCEVLERIALIEPDAERRVRVDEELADLAAKLKDAPRAIAAYERLLETPARSRALEALAPLYEASGDPAKHAWLLEQRAADATDPGRARELLMRAVEVRARETKDPTGAIATCRAIVDRFGAGRDVLALAIPLLEAQRLWADLAEALAQDAALAAGREQAEVLARLGTVRMVRLRDVPGALDAFQEALAFDPQERTSRTTLEKLAAVGEHRLAAGRVLEPVYRREGAAGPLLKVLDLRGSLAPDLDERLDALREAAALAGAADAGRALDLVGRGLAEAVAGERPIQEWLDAVDTLAQAGAGADPKRRAAILGKAIGEREVTSVELGALARRAAEAHAASDDAPSAIALYRRALAFEPHSGELLSRIDDLLRDQGSPRERIALYRAVLARGDASPASRKKELVHRIGAIEWHDLGDVAAATTTYRSAIADDADDADAHAALAELYAQAGRWEDLCELLETRLARAEGDLARSLRARLAEVAASRGDEVRARTQSARLLEDPDLGPEHLDAVDHAAERLGDAHLARAVLRRRAEMAQDPREQMGWLDKLGDLDETRLGDLASAAAAWKRAAALAEAGEDDEAARRLYRRARAASPTDPEVTARLVTLCERAELFAELPELYASLAEQGLDADGRADLALKTAQVLSERLADASGAAESAARALELAPARADILATFERLSVAAGTASRIETTIDGILARMDATRRDGTSTAPGGWSKPIDSDALAQLLLARARSLAADPGRADDTARAYRAILEEPRLDRTHQASALAAFDALVARDPESPRRLADLRWLLEWRTEHAPEEDRVARLLEWAFHEEKTFADPVRALALHRRALALDGEHDRSDEALAAIARLALATGETEDALTALRTRRDRAEGPARVAIELEMAHVLLARTTRWGEALSALRAVLAEAPGEPAARGLAMQLLAHRGTRAETIAMLEQACEATDDAPAREEILRHLIEAPTPAGNESLARLPAESEARLREEDAEPRSRPGVDGEARGRLDPEEAQSRQKWFERLSDLQRERGSVEEALATAARAARELPQVDALWDRAEELARLVSRPDDVAALYADVLARSLPQEQAVAIGERAVQFYEEWFDDPARVVSILERVLELDPTADWAFDRLKLVLDSAERWDDLFVLYDRALESATGRKRATLLEDAAQTAKDFADRPDRAIRYLEQLQELKPGDPKLASSLERLYERQGKHRELVSLLSARLPSLRPDEARRTRARVAALWLDELGEASAALETIEPLLEHAEAADGPVASEVWGLLERVLAAAPQAPESRRSSLPPRADGAPRQKRARKSEAPASSRGSVRQRAAAWLRDHYAATGRDADLARMLLIELETVRSSKERVRRHLQVADLYEKLGDLANALEQTGLAVVDAPEDDVRRAKLRDLAERTGRLDRLADLLSAAAASAQEGPLQISLVMQAASIRADRVGDAAGGIALYSSILVGQGVPEESVLAAARELEPLLEATGRIEERLDVTERIAHVEREPDAKRSAIGRAARLATQLGQHARGIALWETRVKTDERDAEALDGLVDLLDRVGDSERLAQVLDWRARASANVESRRTDRVRLAKLLGDVLHRPEDAIESWRGIENDFGEAEDAALALSALLRQTARWPELAAMLQRRVERSEEVAAKAELLRQLGDVHRSELGAYELSVGTYAKALEVDPRNAGARAGLQALANEGTHRASAVAVLMRALRACDDWQGLLELTAHRLLAESTEPARLAVLLEVAEISEQRAGDAGLAFEAMRRAFALAPGDARVQAEIERLAAAADAWPGLIEAYLAAIEGPARGDVPLVLRLWHKVGWALEAHRDDLRGALVAYLNVLAGPADVARGEGAANLEVGSAAVRVAGKLSEWDVAARAVVDLARAVGTAPGEVLDVLERAAEAAGAWDEATRALDDATSGSDLRGVAARDLLARAAELHRDRRGDAGAAETALQRALEHDAANVAILAALAELQRRTGGRPLVGTLLRLSRARSGDFALLQEASDVASESVGDRPLARSIASELLGLARERWSGGDGGGRDDAREDAPGFARWAIERLVRLHEQDADARAVLEVLVAGDGLPFEPDVRRDLRRRAARIALDPLGDDDRAIALYGALFDDDPLDAEAVDRLASTYAKHGRVRELLSLRERQIASTQDPGARIELRLEAARLLVGLGESDGAADALHANLREAPGQQATVEALVALLDREGKSADLRALLVSEAELAESLGDGARAAELWSRAAVLAEERLRDADASARYHARVVALEPRAASFDALARLADARQDHAVAADWLEKLVGAASPDASADRTSAVLRLGEALVAAGQAERAAERLDAWLRADPAAASVRERLATLYREQSAWPKLARLVAGAAAHAPDKATKMARLLEAARLHADRCGEPEEAIPLLEQASDLAPDDQTVRLGLADALANARRFDEAAAILQAMIDAFGGRRPKERAPVHYQIARLQLSMGNRARALVELDTATRVDPQNPEILRALAELARDDGQLDRAEKSYRALLGVLRRREPTAGHDGQAAIARSEVLLELSAIAERHGESDRSKEILESAIEAGAQSDFEQERLEGALRARGDDDTLVRVLESKLTRLADSVAAARALTELAEVLSDRLGRPERALSIRLRAVAMDPRSDAGHEAALALARSVGEVRRYVDEAAALVAPAISGGDVPLACALLARLGAVAETDLGEDRRAAALYERAVELGERSPDLLRALDGVYGRLGDPDKQARVLSLYVEAQTREGGQSRAADAIYRLAALRLASRETLDEGAEMMRGALDVEPQYDRAVETLRRALALDPSHRALIDLYERVGRQPGHERALVDALTLRARLPGGDVGIVREAVDVAMRIGDKELAESLLARFAEADEANAADLAWALGVLASFREEAGDLAHAVELKRRAARIAEPDVARRLEFEAASIAADKLGDLASAAEIYEALRAADPADRDAWEPLALVYRRLGDSRKLADLLATVVEYVEDMGERGRLRLERVRTMVEGLGLDDAQAAPLLREIVDEDPSQLDAALMLAGMLERSGDSEELASLLSRQIDAAKDRGDAPSIGSLALRLGHLLEQRDRSDARTVYYTGLDWEPSNPDLLDALLLLLDSEDDANERADVTERRVAVAQGPEAEAMALALWQTRVDLGDEAAGERALELGYRAYPASAALRGRLEERYRARSEWAKLAELCLLDAGAREDREERLSRLLEAANLWRSEVGDARSAANALALAREVSPDDPSLLYEHVNALVEAGDAAGAAAALGVAIEQPSEDTGRRAALLGARASIRATIGESDGALEDLEAAFALEPEPYAAALGARLESACEAAAASGDAAAVRALRLRQAHVLPLGGESERARTLLAEIVKQDPRDHEALETLANLEVSLERWDAASATLRRLVGIAEGDAAIDAALRLADACERAGRPGDARGALERARQVAPQQAGLTVRLTAQLERVYELTGAWRELAELALQDARASGDVAERFTRLLRAGSLLLDHAGDAQAAIDALQEARALRPTDPDCIGLLADALLALGRTADAFAVLDQFVGPSKGRRTREFAGLHWRLSRVARATGDAAGELRAIVAALECDAQSGQVCSDVAVRAMEIGQLDLASRALRAVTLLKTPGPMSKALAYQYMGEIARVQGDPKRALTLVKRALVEDPTLEGARALAQTIERGG
ncbi:MAG TPA: tetratricopeptide repeat protein [Polyangiaceae bacterium]|nr:tetratricopeptide repeat protein [Polyangiaceae bacterium]